MLLSGVLFVLFLAGCWLYCLADAALTPDEAFPGWRKRTWVVVIAVTPIAGAIAWLIARRNWRASYWPPTGTTYLMMMDDRGNANVIWYPHWAPESAPIGPDDDPEFLRQLAQRIHGTPTDPAE